MSSIISSNPTLPLIAFARSVAAAQRRESALVPGHGVWPAAASGMLVSGCLSGIGASKAAPHV